jgi:hypothetical protein
VNVNNSSTWKAGVEDHEALLLLLYTKISGKKIRVVVSLKIFEIKDP